MKSEVHKFEDIKIGDSASFNKKWTKEDVSSFALLSGDTNPIHTDESYAKTTTFGQTIVHGMLVASSFSTLVGMYLPGKYCVYVKQDIAFKKPVHIGDNLKVEGKVSRKIEASNMLEISLKISRGSEVVVEGTALVQVQKPNEK